jgi:hypothetical protein
MMIIGVDYHPSSQTIAFLMEETRECGEQELNHSDGAAERFYRELQRRGIRVRVGNPSMSSNSGCSLSSRIRGNRFSLPVDLHSQRSDNPPGKDRKQTVSFRSLTPFQIRHRNSEREH